MKKTAKQMVSMLILVCLLIQPALAADGQGTKQAKSDLPQVYLTITDESAIGVELTKDMGYVAAAIEVVDPTGEYTAVLDAGSQLKIRGNSTSEGAKKPYNIKFSGKTDLLGMGKGKKWCLLANMYDKSLMRNNLVFDFARAMGMQYVPDCRMVDVWMNDEYAGTYLLCEPVEANSTRVDIDIDAGDYLLEFERSRVEEGVQYITTRRYGMRFSMQEPEEITSEQSNDLLNRLGTLEDAIATNDYQTMALHMDMDSFVDMYVVEEFFKNVDCNMSSVKFYYKDNILYAGPVWDYDLSSGNCSSSYYSEYNNRGNGGRSYENFYANNSIWYRYLLKNSTFMDKVKARYLELQPLIINLYRDNDLGKNRIDRLLEQCNDSFHANWTVWNVASADSILERIPDKTFTENVEYLRSWLENRNNWMLRTYGLDTEPGTEPEKSNHMLDDFEDYSSGTELRSVYTRNANGGANSTDLVAAGNEAIGGSTAMQFTYTLTSAGYSGVYRNIDEDLTGIKGISLWIQGDGQGQDILLQLSDGASYEAHLNRLEAFDQASVQWQHLYVPIEEFTPKTGNGTINLDRVATFALYVNAVNGTQLRDSVIKLDEIKLIFTDEPEEPDTEALTAAIEAAEAVDKANYTAGSVAALEEALEAAKAALESGDQAQIDAAAAALNAAIEALVEKSYEDQLEALWEAVRKAQAAADAAQEAADEAAQSAGEDRQAAEAAARAALEALEAVKAAQEAAETARVAAEAADDDTVAQARKAAEDAAKSAENAANAARAQAAAQAAQALAEEAQKAAEAARKAADEAAKQAGEDKEAAEAAQKVAEEARKAAEAAQKAAEAAKQAADASNTAAADAAKRAADAAAQAARVLENVAAAEARVAALEAKAAEDARAAEEAAEAAKKAEEAAKAAALTAEKGNAKLQTTIAALDVDTSGFTPAQLDALAQIMADAFDAIDAAEDSAAVNKALEDTIKALAELADEGPFRFDDVKDASVYYCEPVYWAYYHEPQITTGTSDTLFSPNMDCSRAQVVTFLWRAAGEPRPESSENPFGDVPADQYYTTAVLWAVEQGITKGTGNNNFSPDKTCSRAEIVTFLWRANGEPKAETKVNLFEDVPEGQFYTDAVLWAVEQGVTKGTSETAFSPDRICTRAEIVTFLQRAVEGR